MHLSKEYVKECEGTIIANLKNKEYVVGHKNVSLRFRKLMQFINKHRTPTSWILDIGSGAYMPLYTYATHACDVSIVAGDILKQSGWGGIFTVASCDELPYRNKQFDIAVCAEVIEHLPTIKMVKKTFSEIERVARRWYIDTPLASKSGVKDSWNIEPSHKQFFSMGDLLKLTESNKVTIITGDNHAFITRE